MFPRLLEILLIHPFSMRGCTAQNHLNTGLVVRWSYLNDLQRKASSDQPILVQFQLHRCGQYWFR
jgi:hypothetical protein